MTSKTKPIALLKVKSGHLMMTLSRKVFCEEDPFTPKNSTAFDISFTSQNL